MGEHGAAMIALPWLAVVVFTLLAATQLGADRGSLRARLLMDTISANGPSINLALLTYLWVRPRGPAELVGSRRS